jgi:vacuolar-type H+-ATPase subunit C/Vma6
MYDYGNARIAALRSRLFDAAALRRFADAGSTGAFIGLLELSGDWRSILRETTPLTPDPQAAIEASIERHRSARLGALPPMYPPPAHRLVASLVLPLDRERIVSIVRRRSKGETPDSIGATIVGGALLDGAALGAIVRSPSLAALVRSLERADLIAHADAVSIVTALRSGIGQRELEERLVAAFDASRAEWAAGHGPDARAVRTILAREREDRDAVQDELTAGGASAASLVERTVTLARLDELARTGRRDPLGIGSVAGYVASVEAQAIRLRASLARVVAGWGHDLVGTYLAPSGS